MIYVINAGSSSVKFSVFTESPLTEVVSGQAALRDTEIVLQAQVFGTPCESTYPAPETEQTAVMSLVHAATALLTEQVDESPRMIVHRVVHGGTRFVKPMIVSPEIREALEHLVDLAPLHQPVNLAAIDACAGLFPDIPQIACFDTAFHADQSDLETHFALPAELFARGIRKYGFHGLSYSYIVSQFPRFAIPTSARVIICHLGNGASLCAVHEGRSVASTMGFTALEGLPMGTRSGRLDPGVVLHLMTQDGWSADEVEHLLYRESGLKGLSGVSADVRTLEQSESAAAQFALDYFAYRINAEMGSLTAILGGIDVVIFTAGIGEHSASVRKAVCQRLSQWLPIAIDDQKNITQRDEISADTSQIRVLRIPTDENLNMAQLAEHMI